MEKADEKSKYYSCNRFDIVKSLLKSYLYENKSFDTDEFRRLASLLKENYNAPYFKNFLYEINNAMYNRQIKEKVGIGLIGDSYLEEIYQKALFNVNDSLSSQRELAGDENLLAAPVPAYGEKNSADCVFVCVNPNSEHLAETLLFIERTASRFADRKNSFVLKNKDSYGDDPFTQSLYEIYENASITFNVSLEIYRNDFESYVRGEIDIEKFISEADRKLSAYLNE